jgi:hypothetical protein
MIMSHYGWHFRIRFGLIMPYYYPIWTSVKTSQFVNKVCSQLLTSLEQVVIIYKQGWWGQQARNKMFQQSLISSARNKLLTSSWQQARSNLLRTICMLGQLVASLLSIYALINLVTRR